jgi:uncharacterized protein
VSTTAPGRLDPTSPWVFSTRELGRRAGVARRLSRTIPAPGEPEVVGLDVVAVPEGSPIELQVQLESVTEGVYASGTIRAALVGECSRCLDEFTDEVTERFGELYAYPDSITDETTGEDELPRVVDEHVDVEQLVRDALLGDLPMAPLCSPDCRGLCSECGEKWADVPPDHGHETLDPRWAALRERLSAD